MATPRALAAAGFASVLLTASLASATSLIRLSTEDLALLSDAVVVARVEDVRPERTDTGMIFTKTTLDLEEVWKGRLEAPSYLEIVTLGGTVGDKSAVVSGVPVFLRGERVLLYLKQDKQRRWRAMGMVQGKLTVLTDASGKERAARISVPLDWSGRDIADADVKARLVPNKNTRDLAELHTELEHAMAEMAATGVTDARDLPRFKGMFHK